MMMMIVSARAFTCSVKNGKAKFYRAFNAIFGKVGRLASEEVVVELLMKKCVPALLYGIEVCPLSRSVISDLDFALTGSFMKIFNTKSKDVAYMCIDMFCGSSINVILERRKKNFEISFSARNDIFCDIFSI